MDAKFTTIHPDAKVPTYATPGSVGFDFTATETVVLDPGKVALVPTGLVIRPPKGKFLLLAVRSSLAFKRGVMMANGVGIVDPDYCGPTDEVKFPLINVTNEVQVINAGDRIGQGLFLPAKQVEWVRKFPQEDDGAEPETSRGGFGSTGGL